MATKNLLVKPVEMVGGGGRGGVNWQLTYNQSRRVAELPGGALCQNNHDMLHVMGLLDL